MIFSRELFFYLFKTYSFIYTGLFEKLKARFLKSIITWSEMGQQTVQAKEVYSKPCAFEFDFTSDGTVFKVVIWEKNPPPSNLWGVWKNSNVKYIWNNSYLYCGMRWKWSVIIAVNFQFKQLERRSLKKLRLQRDSNPWPPRYRCDALPTELWSHTLGARSIYWVHFFPCSEIMWNIYEIIHICTASMRWKWSVISNTNI